MGDSITVDDAREHVGYLAEWGSEGSTSEVRLRDVAAFLDQTARDLAELDEWRKAGREYAEAQRLASKLNSTDDDFGACVRAARALLDAALRLTPASAPDNGNDDTPAAPVDGGE